MPANKPKPTGVLVRTTWVEAEQMYRVALEPAEGVTVTLTDAQAWNHARAVAAVAHQAVHDAAALTQLMSPKIGVPRAHAATMVQMMQRERKPLDPAITDPLRYSPGVDGKTLKPYVTVSLGSTVVGRWSFAEADDHARTLIAMTERAKQETVYRQLLTSWGMESYRAKNAVADLGTFRKYS
jgi:hypothetical protein